MSIWRGNFGTTARTGPTASSVERSGRSASPTACTEGESQFPCKEMPARLGRLIDDLQAFGRPLGLEELAGVMRDASVTLTDLRPFIQFREETYHRETIYACDAYEVCCLSWKYGQSSPVHDHGHCRCCLRVIQGTLTNTEFLLRNGRPIATRTCAFHPGELVATGPNEIHRAANIHELGLVTLHAYSPRLGAAPKYYQEGR